MQTSSVSGQSPASSTTSTSTATTKNGVLDKNAFLYILTAELSNQDPMNAKDNTEFVAQMAQFSALEQSQNMNSTLSSLLTSQRLTEGAMLIGHNVTFDTGNNTSVTDTVKSVKVQDGSVLLVGQNNTYDISQVSEVGE